MSGTFALPLVLDGSRVRALVVGGGAVASRKIAALRDGGAHVRVRAPRLTEELERRGALDQGIVIERSAYDDAAIGDATLVIAATDDHRVNRRIAEDGRRAGCLVVVADEPDEGNCVMPAVHRNGELLIAVASGGVPRASARVRDAIATRIDDRYATAIAELVRLRRRLLAHNERDAWHTAARALLTDDFCESVESGAFSERLAAWQ